MPEDGPRAGDRALADRLAAGDDDALAEVYDRHSGLVYGLAQQVTGSRAAAEDITQDVFTHLWTHPERFDSDRGSLRAYLGVMAHRRAVDLVRSDARRQAREESDASSGARVAVSLGALPTSAEDNDLSRRVRRAVSHLPEPQREALYLAYFGGHTYRTVATMLGIPEGTAKSRLRLAMGKLADLLHAEGAAEWT